jgi:hypothetical protein
MIIAVAFMASYVFAQGTAKDTRGQFQLGLKAGANFANVYDTQGEEFRADGKLGFVGGAFLTIPLGTMFGIQPEVLFSQKGFKATGNVLGRRYELTRTTNYLDVPLMLSVKPIQYVTVMAGPQFSYLIRQKDTFANANDSFDVIQEFENDNIRKNIMGVIAGIDVNISHLVVGARAGWDLSTNHGDGSSVTPRYKNAWLQATLGYRFL